MMPRKTNNKILKEHLILCEGREEQEVLIEVSKRVTMFCFSRYAHVIPNELVVDR